MLIVFGLLFVQREPVESANRDVKEDGESRTTSFLFKVFFENRKQKNQCNLVNIVYQSQEVSNG